MEPFYKKLTIAILPILLFAWGIFLFIFFDPFYSAASDPEYPYLINGLNCALGEFNRIGLIEHPGTPYEIFCGIIILITYLFTGTGGIAHDVFARPENYMNAISISLLLVQIILILAIGISALKRKIPLWQIALLQASCLFNDLLMWLGCRINSERFFLFTALIFILVYLKHGFENRSPQKFALWSGTTMALGLATKFNFLPLLFLPLLFIYTNKNRLIYVGSGIVSFFIFLLPIINKFGDYRRFLMSIFTHDGLYGGGESKIMNFRKISDSIGDIFSFNPELVILILTLYALIVIAFQKRNEGYKRDLVVFIGFLFIIVLQCIMVSKHFKNSYLTPTFIFYGFIFFILSLYLSKILEKKSSLILACTILPILFILSTAIKITHQQTLISKKITQRNKIRNFVDTSISKSDFWFVEPTWESAPYVENALVYGLSYCAHRSDYKAELMAINPNIITYEGNESVQFWRVAPASLDSVVATKKNIYLYSSPGRQASILLQMLKNSAKRNQSYLLVDTVFSDTETNNHIIRTKLTADSITIRYSIHRTDSLMQSKLQKYIQIIKSTPDWLEVVKEKAIIKNIPLDSMILLDAQYLIDTEK